LVGTVGYIYTAMKRYWYWFIDVCG